MVVAHDPIEIRYVKELDEWECDWGVFENPAADLRYPLHRLLITTVRHVEELLRKGPQPRVFGGKASASMEGDRLYIHLDTEFDHATWQLFPARYCRDDALLVGKWPE